MKKTGLVLILLKLHSSLMSQDKSHMQIFLEVACGNNDVSSLK